MHDTRLTKRESCFCQTTNAVLLAGIIMLFTGIYYCVIKAGIPYQDPPLELQIQYAVNMGIGEILVKDGFLMSLCGMAVRLLFQFVWKKRRKK